MSVTYLNPRRQPPAYSQHTMPKLMAQRINLLAKMRRKPIQDDANDETQLGCRFEGPLQELQNLFESVRTLLPSLHQSFIRRVKLRHRPYPPLLASISHHKNGCPTHSSLLCFGKTMIFVVLPAPQILPNHHCMIHPTAVDKDVHVFFSFRAYHCIRIRRLPLGSTQSNLMRSALLIQRGLIQPQHRNRTMSQRVNASSTGIHSQPQLCRNVHKVRSATLANAALCDSSQRTKTRGVCLGGGRAHAGDHTLLE